MIVRQSTDSDIPAIVELLKVSLGESLLPKSDTYWRWKHLENPFGRSPVLVAEVDNRLVGVRAFMKWQWSIDGKTLYALRAVDTATHPEYQGRGIFKKLTLSILETDSSFTDFIYNTPNDKSRPGYLKMGWSIAGRLPIGLSIVNPLGSKTDFDEESNFKDWILTSEAKSFLLSLGTMENSKELVTVPTQEFLTWRYGDVPMIKYHVLFLEEMVLVIYRLKQVKWIKELRIVDVIGNKQSLTRNMIRRISQEARKVGAHIVTSSGLNQRLPIHLMINKGPWVTVREGRYPLVGLIGFTRWKPSIGDMELF
jgi:GNAT superfamily N-acetyltransferase